MQQEPRKNIQRTPGKSTEQLKIPSICIFYAYCMLCPLIQSWSSIPASSTHRGPAVFTVLILYYFTWGTWASTDLAMWSWNQFLKDTVEWWQFITTYRKMMQSRIYNAYTYAYSLLNVSKYENISIVFDYQYISILYSFF